MANKTTATTALIESIFFPSSFLHLIIVDDFCRAQSVGKGNNEANKIGMDLVSYQIH